MPQCFQRQPWSELEKSTVKTPAGWGAIFWPLIREVFGLAVGPVPGVCVSAAAIFPGEHETAMKN